MVALRDISGDFYEFDADNYRLVGRRSGIVYQLGDPVRIRVKKTNLDQMLLDYELIESGNEKRLPASERPSSAGSSSRSSSSRKPSSAKVSSKKPSRKTKKK